MHICITPAAACNWYKYDNDVKKNKWYCSQSWCWPHASQFDFEIISTDRFSLTARKQYHRHFLRTQMPMLRHITPHTILSRCIEKFFESKVELIVDEIVQEPFHLMNWSTVADKNNYTLLMNFSFQVAQNSTYSSADRSARIASKKISQKKSLSFRKKKLFFFLTCAFLLLSLMNFKGHAS